MGSLVFKTREHTVERMAQTSTSHHDSWYVEKAGHGSWCVSCVLCVPRICSAGPVRAELPEVLVVA
jgi:hypothetical protein